MDTGARTAISEALDDTLVVEAAAGTGKTTALVGRMLRVLATGRATVDRIVAVTFTEKAAGELKLRLRERLEVERLQSEDDDVKRRLDAAVQRLEEAHVSTIHGFCADLLRERPVEARVDPLFRVLTEGQAGRVFDDAFDAWFHAIIENPPEGVRRSLRRPSPSVRPGDADEDGPTERLRRAGLALTEWRDFPQPWIREPFDRRGEMARLLDLVHTLATVSERPSYAGDNLFVDTGPVRVLSRDLLTRALDDPDGLEARFVELKRHRDFRRARKGSGPTYGPGVTRAQVLAARDALTEALNGFQERADADLAALLREELLECVRAYEALKTREGALDFLDLLVRARDLIRGDRATREHFQRRFTHIFVDEFQDTDPLQAELLLLLASSDPVETDWQRVPVSPGKLFIVGDPKQSLYRFRRADVDLYRQVCDQLVRGGARAVTLETSFRAVPSLQRFVNAAFEPLMGGGSRAGRAGAAGEVGGARGAGQAGGYVPLAPHREEYEGQPSVVALPVPEPYGQRYVSAQKIEQSLPDAVGAWVDWLLHESGWTVTERREPATRVPVQARHVCLLFRRFLSYGDDVTRPYTEAFEARGVTHLLVGGRAFHDREEIETLRAALTAVEWPDDQLSVFATLRGALFAVGDEELLEYRHTYGAFHPFRVPGGLPPHLEPIGDALTTLRSLHVHRNRRPVADTIGRLIEATRAHVGFVLRPGGEQVLANVLHVAELARQYEIDGGLSFRGFVHRLQEESAGLAAAEAPILEEGSDGVRLMTVHKAKGLEFPVVILADMTARLAPFEAGRFIDPGRGLCALRVGGWSPRDLLNNQVEELERERHEGERVAYVAATRARDLLVVPVIGDAAYDGGWVSPLNAALYPPEEARRTALDARGCPPFRSRDSVLTRPDNDPATRDTVCPGEHRMGADANAYSVVWWSPEPGLLRLGARPPFGLRRDDLIVKDVPFSVVQAQHDGYRAWKDARETAQADARTPSLTVLTATEAARSSLDLSRLDGIDVTFESASAAGTEGGARFGTLVHALLADVPFDEDDLVDGLARTHGRVLGATGAEVARAAGAVRAVMAQPVMRRAAAAAHAGRCYREAPVTYTIDGTTMIEGIVDLAFEDDDGYTVVDFKTDRDISGSEEQYRRQVRIYAGAVAAATGRPARGIVLRVSDE